MSAHSRFAGKVGMRCAIDYVFSHSHTTYREGSLSFYCIVKMSMVLITNNKVIISNNQNYL